MAQISKTLAKISNLYGSLQNVARRHLPSNRDGQEYMSAIESGKKNVTIAVVEKLARALDVSVDELLK